MSTLPAIPHASDVEKAIVGRLVTDLLAAGLTISVWNGGDEAELVDSSDAEAIFAELCASDQDELTMEGPDGYAGWIRLVWGNDHSVISDYTTRLEAIMAPANKLADDLECSEVIFQMNLAEMKRRSNPVARFWVWYGNGLVRIKLRKGQQLSCSEGGQTDEGFSYTGHCWAFDGEEVSYDTVTNARDCDGPISRGGSSFCRLADLNGHYSREDGVPFPKWQDRGKAWQRDANAEAAGY